MKKIYDVSLTITPTLPVWDGDAPVRLERIQRMEDGANCNVTEMQFGVHVGTHVDAPVHFVPGREGVDKLSLETLIGEAQLIHLPDSCDLITADVIRQAGLEAGVSRVLFRTRNSQLWARGETVFRADYVGVSADAAEYLVKIGVRLVGVDYLSIAPRFDTRTTHDILLGAGLIPLEGLSLSAVPAGKYQLVCLPLKLGGSDGAPARTVLIEM